MPWASGKRRPPPKKQPWVKRVKKSVAKTLRKHPTLGLVAQIGFALSAIALLVTGLLLENLLFILASAMAALGAVATRRAVFLEQERQMRAGPKVTMPPPSSRPRKPNPAGAAAPPPASGPVKCTETGRPIEGDSKCDCASRHVATEEGARRYGRAVGAPLGRKSKQQKASGTARTGG